MGEPRLATPSTSQPQSGGMLLDPSIFPRKSFLPCQMLHVSGVRRHLRRPSACDLGILGRKIRGLVVVISRLLRLDGAFFLLLFPLNDRGLLLFPLDLNALRTFHFREIS